jgi:hypothetical protein
MPALSVLGRLPVFDGLGVEERRDVAAAGAFATCAFRLAPADFVTTSLLAVGAASGDV